MTTTTRKTHNGHPSRNYWNVSLWINNDEGLYRLVLECLKVHSTRRHAAVRMHGALNGGGRANGAKTPDGSPYTVASIMHAMRGMER